MNEKREWATLVLHKVKGGRAVVLNESQRGLFHRGQRYFNHRLKVFPEGLTLNVVVRLSKTGRKMVQEIHVKPI